MSDNSKPGVQSPPCVISPWMDSLCVGGASLVILIPMLALDLTGLLGLDQETHPWLHPVMALAGALINMPHFMASYRMVYRSRETIMRYKWASIYVPAALAAYGCFAVATAEARPEWMAYMIIATGAYLAWHYTGQAWGMMMVFSRMEGLMPDKLEARLIRGGLRIMLAWHVIWFLNLVNSSPAYEGVFLDLYAIINNCTVLAACLGIWGFVRLARRTGRLPTIRMLLPWAAIFIWYAAMARDTGAIFWVQIAHALQYLSFPARVEWNRTVRQRGETRSHARRHMAAFALALVALGFVVERVLPGTIVHAADGQMAPEMVMAAMMAPNFFLNIHHYFTDGVVWKLRDPAVRADLFGHLESHPA